MSTYLKFFELEQSPFEGREGTQVVLGTQALRDALATIRTGLDDDVARICVSGGPGLGKTSLARALPKLLGDASNVAIVLDPSVDWQAARGSIARQWGLPGGGLPRAGLVEAACTRRLVLVIDSAETASEAFLDHLDVVLSYRGEDGRPVVQSVLLAQLSGGDPSSPPPLLWWLDRIQTLQLEFAPLPRDGVDSYIQKHLKRAGWQGSRLFQPEAALAIHGYTGGIPGEVSKLCERLLEEAADRDLREIDAAFVHAICDAPDESGEGDADDDFEELVLDDEIAGREAPASTIDLVEAVERSAPGTGLSETLERFGPTGAADRAEFAADENPDDQLEDDFGGDAFDAIDDGLGTFDATGDGDDASVSGMEGASGAHADARQTATGATRGPFAALEAILSAPASMAELRAIRGTFLARHARALATAAAAAIVGGLLLAWLTGGAPPAPPDIDDPSIVRSGPAAGGDAEAPGATRPLARIRGPVQRPVPTRPDVDASRATRSPTIANRPPPSTGTAGSDTAVPPPLTRDVPDLDDDTDEPIDEKDLVDLRPATLRRGAGNE